MAETKRELLPSDALPEHYDLTLEPDIEKFAFDGVVKITCDVQARGPGEQWPKLSGCMKTAEA